MLYSTWLLNGSSSLFAEVAVRHGACTVVCVCSALCSPQSPVAFRTKPLHQRPFCLSAQRQGKEKYIKNQ